MSEYKILMGKSSLNLWDAILAQQFNPSEENQKRLDDLHRQNSLAIMHGHQKNIPEFIELNGQDVYDFVCTIHPNSNFLFALQSPFSLWWNVKDDENDDYWKIRLCKGQFDYTKEICGGYAGSEMIEENISQARVLELLTNKE